MVKVSNLSEFSVQTWNGNGFNELIKSNITSSGKEIDITGITEMHTTNDAQLTGFGNVFRSGGDPNDKFSGVGLILSDKAKKALIFTNAVSSRILMARFKGRFAYITVIVVYIPHQGRKQAPFQEDTYSELENAINAVNNHDCLIVMGDFNSRLARSDRHNDYRDNKLVGRWSIHHRDCVGGVILRGLLQRQNLCAVSTKFQPRVFQSRKTKRSRSNATWLNPQVEFKPSQIDHILVCQRFMKWFTNCQVKWGPSINRWGKKQDHACFQAFLNTSITAPSSATKKSYDLSKLSNEDVREKYRVDVETNLAKQPIPETLNGRWLHLKLAVLESAETNLKPEKNPLKRKSYMSTSTLNLVVKRKHLFEQIRVEGNVVDSEMTKEWRTKIHRSLRQDFRDHVEDICKQMEEAQDKGEVRLVHTLRKRLTGKSKKVSSTITTDLSGKVLTTEPERLAVWSEYYGKKFEPAPPLDPTIIPIYIQAIASVRISHINADNNNNNNNNNDNINLNLNPALLPPPPSQP
jgi:exonuclease III